MKELKAAHEQAKVEKEKAEAEKQAEDRKREERVETFRASVRESSDLADQLQSLVDHLKDITGSTAVYVGKVV